MFMVLKVKISMPYCDQSLLGTTNVHFSLLLCSVYIITSALPASEYALLLLTYVKPQGYFYFNR